MLVDEMMDMLDTKGLTRYPDSLHHRISTLGSPSLLLREQKAKKRPAGARQLKS